MHKANTLSQYITESTFNLSSDVDLIYDVYFSDFVNSLWEGSFDPDAPLPYTKELRTSALTSPKAVKANAINPSLIIINANANIYRKDLIQVGIHRQVLDIIRDSGSLRDAIRDVERYNNKKVADQFKTELTPARIKGSIHHELSHWVDDALHNNHISNRVAYTSELDLGNKDKARRHMNQGQIARVLTNYEINAQIHSIIELKRGIGEVNWNNITLDQMIEKSPSLHTIKQELLVLAFNDDNLNAYQLWKKILRKRMHREGLLGENMR